DDGNTVNTDACHNDCTLPVCGNGVRENNEQCDDGNGSATDGCLPGCKQAYCGDGIVRAGYEDCDPGNEEGTPCPASCMLTCGNGTVEAGEQCDDGNAV